ncbi:MAG: hypothetical protein KGZ55_08705 [Sphingomonadaceae bacterium]|nr:hypothetical protein [Sphingomonadaceae bacterium]
MQIFKDEPDRRPDRLGAFQFCELPRIGEEILIADEIDLVYYRVASVVHYPIPHPFVLDEEMPNSQDKDPSVKIEVIWIGIE